MPRRPKVSTGWTLVNGVSSRTWSENRISLAWSSGAIPAKKARAPSSAFSRESPAMLALESTSSTAVKGTSPRPKVAIGCGVPWS
jgi:hypothetical protein